MTNNSIWIDVAMSIAIIHDFLLLERAVEVSNFVPSEIVDKIE